MVSSNPATVAIPPNSQTSIVTLNVVVSSLNSTSPLSEAIYLYQNGLSFHLDLFLTKNLHIVDNLVVILPLTLIFSKFYSANNDDILL